jgi:hypothetical protein
LTQSAVADLQPEEASMKRRLYFLFPDAQKARRAVEELDQAGIDRTHIHALAKEGVALPGLPGATPLQKADWGHRIERMLWGGNLAIFGIALLFVVVALPAGFPGAMVFALAVMLATFAAGAAFALKVPHVHLGEFRDALAHGEVLLMVDVPRGRVSEVEDRVHRHHPEATVGGVGWSADMLRV